MKHNKLVTLALSAVFALTTFSAFAQPQGGPPGGGPGGGFQRGPGGPGGMQIRMGRGMPGLPPLMMVLHRPDVQREIGFTEAQRNKLDDLMEQGGMFRRQDGPPGAGGPPGGGVQMRQRQGGGQGQGPDFQAMEKQRKEHEAKIRAILTGSQNKRVDEIRVQIAGLTAALDPEIQTKIGVTNAQKQKLDELMPRRGPGGPGGQFGRGPGGPGGAGPGGPPQGGQGQRRQGPPGGGEFGRGPGGPEGGLDAKIAEILTDAQEAALKKLGGKPFQTERRDR